MTRQALAVGVVFALSASWPRHAAAQLVNGDEGQARRPGWSLTSSVTAGAQWDDNVLVQGNDDAPISEPGSVLAPAGSLDYLGRRGELSLGYSGNFSMYRELAALNSFEQTQRLSMKRRFTRRTSVSAFESFAVSPTTELMQLVGVPFVRVGSRIANAGASFDITASRRTTITGSYLFQWIRFDQSPLQEALVGGESHGGRFGIRRIVSRRWAMSVDTDATRATIASGGVFAVQDAMLGLEYRVNDLTRIFANTGAARLDAADLHQPKITPSWRMGVARQFNPFGVEVVYGRTFVPSYAGGSTEANDELTLRVFAPLGRRGYANGGGAWRQGGVLVENDLPLTSVWTNLTVGYAFRPWARLEGFYSGMSQRIDRPGGALDRRRVGVQISLGAPVRIG